MTTVPALAPTARLELTWRSQLRSGWRRLHAVLLVAWLLLGLATVLLGERHSSFGSLEGQLAAGQVRDVRVAGVSLGPGHRGFTTLEVHWRHHLVNRVAEVVEVSSRREARNQGLTRTSSTPVIGPDVITRLLRDRPDVRITRTDGVTESATAGDWQVPGWLLWLDIVAGVLTFWLLTSGPEPWRATRWAWFWLLFVAFPLGPLVFVTLSGPTPLLKGPGPAARRLTGGWAFLLAVALHSL